MERYASGLAGSFQPGRLTPYFVVVCRRSEWSFIAEFDIMEIISALLSVCCQCISIRLGPSKLGNPPARQHKRQKRPNRKTRVDAKIHGRLMVWTPVVGGRPPAEPQRCVW
jgi:hypothetical protein